jgi:hypothetical protein
MLVDVFLKYVIKQGTSGKLWLHLNFFFNSIAYLAICQNETFPLLATITQIHPSISTQVIPKVKHHLSHPSSLGCGFRELFLDFIKILVI